MLDDTRIFRIHRQGNFLQPRQFDLQFLCRLGTGECRTQLLHQTNQNGLTQGGSIVSAQHLAEIGTGAAIDGHLRSRRRHRFRKGFFVLSFRQEHIDFVADLD